MTDPSDTKDGSDVVKHTRGPAITYEFDTDELPSEAIVRATAAQTGMPVTELDPLFNVVDHDHLNGLFDVVGRQPAADEVSVGFTFNGCRVSVTGEEVVVRSINQTTD